MTEHWSTYHRTDNYGTKHCFPAGTRETGVTDVLASLRFDNEALRVTLEYIAINECGESWHLEACEDESCARGRAVCMLQKLGRWPRGEK